MRRSRRAHPETSDRTTGSTSDQGTSTAVGVLGAVLAVALVAVMLLGLGVPERLGCEVGAAVVSVSGGGSDACATARHATTLGGSTEDRSTEDRSTEDRSTEDRSTEDLDLAAEDLASDDVAGEPDTAAGELTATTFAVTDSVSSPAIRDAARPAVALPAEYARCAAAPDDPATAAHPGTAICLAGADAGPDGNVFTGSDLVQRCAAATADSSTTCAATDSDPRPSLRTGPGDGGVRFCHPVEVTRTDARAPKSPYRVDWACASWAGNLYHCTNTLSADIITTARSNGLVNYTEPTTWVTDPGFRQTWPRTCDSRTFGPTHLACTPDKATNTAACTVRGFQGLPARPATCAYFHPRAGEDPTRSHTLTKPMHCRLQSTSPPLADCHAPTDAVRGIGGRIRCLLTPVSGLSAPKALLRGCPRAVDSVSAPALGHSRAPKAVVSSTVGSACRQLRPGTVHQAGFVPPGPLGGGQEILVELDPLTPASPGLTPAQSTLLANIQELQATLDLLAVLHGSPLPAVPVILLSNHTSTKVAVYPQGSTGILLGTQHTDDAFALAHEVGHIVLHLLGNPPIRGQSWRSAALHEGFADAFAMLATQAAGQSTANSQGAARLARRLRLEQLSQAVGPHRNGVIVSNVVQNLQALLQEQVLAGAADAVEPAEHVGVLLHLLVEVAATPGAAAGMDEFAAALVAAAPVAGVPVPLIHQALAAQGWAVPGAGGQGVPGAGGQGGSGQGQGGSGQGTCPAGSSPAGGSCPP